MFAASVPRLAHSALRRSGAAATAAATTLTAGCGVQSRCVSSQPSVMGLLSTLKEAASLTVQASLAPRPQKLHRGAFVGSTKKASASSVCKLRTVVPRVSFLTGTKAVPSAATVGSVSSAVVASLCVSHLHAATATGQPALRTAKRFHHTVGFMSQSRTLLAPKSQDGSTTSGNSNKNALQGVHAVDRYREEEEEDQRNEQQDEEDPFNKSSGPGYLPFPPPFHTINIVMILFLANVLCYFAMMFGSDDLRDFIVEHFTLSHENFHRVYPIFTNMFYQENMLQLLIDCWLLWQFGDTMLAFLGNVRLTFFCLLCTLGGSLIHVARQKFELHYGMDELEVRGRCYGPNPMIMGLISMEGLIFRHLNFIQQPPIPFLVLTAFVMVIDVWRIFTTRPEEHGAATGGALMAYLFWALPTRFLGLDKLTATM